MPSHCRRAQAIPCRLSRVLKCTLPGSLVRAADSERRQQTSFAMGSSSFLSQWFARLFGRLILHADCDKNHTATEREKRRLCECSHGAMGTQWLLSRARVTVVASPGRVPAGRCLYPRVVKVLALGVGDEVSLLKLNARCHTALFSLRTLTLLTEVLGCSFSFAPHR